MFLPLFMFHFGRSVPSTACVYRGRGIPYQCWSQKFRLTGESSMNYTAILNFPTIRNPLIMLRSLTTLIEHMNPSLNLLSNDYNIPQKIYGVLENGYCSTRK